MGLSSTSAHREKNRIRDFSAAWDAALAYCVPALERAAYTRAVEGWLEPIVYKGEVVAHRRRYSDAMLRLLLQREDARPAPVVEPPEKVDDGLSPAARGLGEKLRVLARQLRERQERRIVFGVDEEEDDEDDAADGDGGDGDDGYRARPALRSI